MQLCTTADEFSDNGSITGRTVICLIISTGCTNSLLKKTASKVTAQHVTRSSPNKVTCHFSFSQVVISPEVCTAFCIHAGIV